MLLAVIAVLTVGGLAMTANLGLLDLSGRSQQSIDAATTGGVDELGSPLVTAVPSGDGSQQAFVIDGVGTVQIERGLDDSRPMLSIHEVQVLSGWKAEIIPIDPSTLRVEFRSARRAMDFEALLDDDGEIAARFRISRRGAPLVVTSPDGGDQVHAGGQAHAGGQIDDEGQAGAEGQADAGDEGDKTRHGGETGETTVATTVGAEPDDSSLDPSTSSSTTTTVGPATGSTNPGSAPTTSAADSDATTGDDGASSQLPQAHEGTWIYYEDGFYVLQNTLRGTDRPDRSQPPSELSKVRERDWDRADSLRRSGRRTGMEDGRLNDD